MAAKLQHFTFFMREDNSSRRNHNAVEVNVVTWSSLKANSVDVKKLLLKERKVIQY